MNIALNLDTVILFVSDVERLKTFYRDAFNMAVVEETGAEWALLNAGKANIGLHKIGDAYGGNINTGYKSNTKIVFEVDGDIGDLREELLSREVTMHAVTTFKGYDYWLCDGEDPEGNRFQLKQKK